MDFKKIIINLDKERQLKLTFKGMREFEQATGVNISDIQDIQDLTPNELYALVWACLIWQDKDLQLESIPGIIENSSIEWDDLIESLVACIDQSFPEAKPETIPLEIPGQSVS
jgi:hypothetical protein